MLRWAILHPPLGRAYYPLPWWRSPRDSSPSGSTREGSLAPQGHSIPGVVIENTSDCCAYAEVLEFLFNADKVDHIITDVSLNSGEYEINILADMDDVLALRIRWSEGSGYGYSFGFKIKVKELNPEWVKFAEMENQALAELHEAGYEV